MRRISLLPTILLGLLCNIHAAERNIPSTITAVKVFLSGAEVTRSGQVELAKGTTTLVFAGLTDEVDPSNIQVSGTGAFTILGVQHRLNHLEEKQDRAEVLALDARIAGVEADIERERSMLAVVEREDARLGKNEVVAGEQGLTLQQLQSINEYLRTRQEALAAKRLAINRTLTQLSEELGKLTRQLAQLRGKRTRPTSEVMVEVSANAPVNAAITLKYMVASAGWNPSYDIRVADINSPMRLTYKAMIFQSTGEDWDKVQLALSSGDPNKDAVMPVLQPWRLDYGRPVQPVAAVPQGYNAQVREVRGVLRDASTGEPLPFVNVLLVDVNGITINGTVSNVDGFYAIAIPANGLSLRYEFVGYASQHLPINSGTMNVALAPSANQLSEVVIQNSPLRMLGVLDVSKRKQRIRSNRGDVELLTDAEEASTTTASVTDRATSFEFAISLPYTIPGDGKNHQVAVEEQQLVSTYQYYCTPKLDRDAFLFAKVTGWEGLNLLAGPAFIYFEGTFVGESLLDLSGASDTLDISLGRDKGISVQRTKRTDFSQRQVVGGKRTETVGWELVVRNNKAQAVDLVISDQYPVPVRSEIEVKLEEDGGALVNAEKGFLRWKFTLEPRAARNLQFGYSVKVPKEVMITLE